MDDWHGFRARRHLPVLAREREESLHGPDSDRDCEHAGDLPRSRFLIYLSQAYYQPFLSANPPFNVVPAFHDPTPLPQSGWGLNVQMSSNIFVFGAGLYSVCPLQLTKANVLTVLAVLLELQRHLREQQHLPGADHEHGLEEQHRHLPAHDPRCRELALHGPKGCVHIMLLCLSCLSRVSCFM
jgi:hypothetical protein